MVNQSLIIVQAGSPPDEIYRVLGDYPRWFCDALGLPIEEVEIVRVFDGEALPPPDPARAAIITGSWAMVTERLPWSESTAQWIRDAMDVGMPLFGVCYGHQLMAHALGGRVDFHPAGGEIGCHEIRLLDCAASDTLLADMPGRFAAHLTHMQSVIELPPGARVLAASDHDPHQIVRYGRQAISAQFHPEFTPEICAAIIRFHAGALIKEGFDPERMQRQVKPTPEATALLSRFVEQALDCPQVLMKTES